MLVSPGLKTPFFPVERKCVMPFIQNETRALRCGPLRLLTVKKFIPPQWVPVAFTVI